jgi:hypothetical protein
MLLKRKYDLRDPANPVVTGVELRHTGIHAEQNFSTRLVSQALAEGWMEVAGDTILLHTDVGPLRYSVKRAPGYYCCHDGKRIPISEMAQHERLRSGIGRLAAAEARAYLATQGFAGKASPDPAHPAGYLVLEHYECVLDAAQHAKHKAKPGALAPSQRAAKE